MCCSGLWLGGYFQSVRDIYSLRGIEEEGTKFFQNVGQYPVYYMDS